VGWIDDDVIATLSHAEVIERIRALNCGCRSYDDPGLCYRMTDPADYALGMEIGSPVRCDCDCHAIWEAWIAWEDETL
jgi:hypothetical protein